MSKIKEPVAPLGHILYESGGTLCKQCGSSLKHRFYDLFTIPQSRGCIQPKCNNWESRTRNV